jgi:hypothetical protein
VVQTSGGVIWTKGGRATLRGRGNATRPPVVCMNLMASPVLTASGRMSGNAMAGKLSFLGPKATRVTPIQPWPAWPPSMILPFSTSIQARRSLANRISPEAARSGIEAGSRSPGASS